MRTRFTVILISLVGLAAGCHDGMHTSNTGTTNRDQYFRADPSNPMTPARVAYANNDMSSYDYDQNRRTADYQDRTRDVNRDQNRNGTANQVADASSPDARILRFLHTVNQEEIECGRMAQRNGGSAEVKSYGEQLARDHSDNDTKVIALSRDMGISLTGYDSSMNGTMNNSMRDEKGSWERSRNSTARMDATAAGENRTRNMNEKNMEVKTTDDKGMDHTDMDHRNMTRTDMDHRTMDQNRSSGMKNDPSSPMDPSGNRTMGHDRASSGDAHADLRNLQGTEFDRAFVRKMDQGHREAIRMVENARSSVQDSRVRSLLDETLPALRKHEEAATRLTSTR